jgi:ABC-type uncharacterized transport system involved in gliding motility auxiliary subunit
VERPEMRESRFFLYRRSARFWINFLITILIALGITVAIEIISDSYNRRLDLTAETRYTISDQLKKILNSLEEKVNVTVFYQSGERQELNDLLGQFSSQSARFHYELFDLDRNPAKARKYGIKNYGETVIDYRGKRTKISYPTEDKIINAILKITRKGKKVIYFSKGHGENDIFDSSEKKGFSKLKEALQLENYDEKELWLARSKGIPPDVSVLIVNGPKKDFLEAELETLRNFVQEGGRVIFMIDPLNSLPKLSGFLSSYYDVVLGDDIIVDQSNRLFGSDYFTVMIPLFLNHPITRDFQTPCLFPLTRSIEAKKVPRPGVFAQAIAKSAPESWAMSDKKDLTKGTVRFREGVDKKGPVSVAAVVAVESKQKRGDKEEKSIQDQIVVYGDADFTNNFYIDFLGNKDLFLNTINWLSEDEYLISTRPKRPENRYRFLGIKESKMLFWVLVILQPAILLVVGLVVYIRGKLTG